MNKLDRRNMIFFGLGTVGRDMFYALEANALIYYLSNVLDLPLGVFVATSMVFTVLRVFDALNDPIMGLLVDNTRSRHGRFKPPMALGALAGGACYLVLFADFGLRDYWFVAVFAIAYILWDIFYGLNDIAYWSMLPSLSVEQKTREKMGAFARICANIGMFAIMVGWEPITSGLGNTPKAWFTVALAVTILMLLFQLFTLFGVKERKDMFRREEEKTTLRGMWEVLTKNDQLLWTTLAMSLFNIGYMSTTTMAIYYMQYVYGNKDMYAVLAAVCGLFAAGLYQFALILLKVPSSRTTKAIKAIAARNRPTAAGFKNTYNDISLFVSRFIRLNEFKKKELADSLKIANISMSPELFTARALVRSAGIMLMSVPFFFFLPIIGLLVIVLAVLMYFQEKQKVDSCIKEKRKQIEFDLPRFVYAISQEIQMSHDVISILERHKDNFSPYLNEEIEITIADMRTGNYEAAITRFEGRIGSTNLSEVCRGFIQMIRGDDTSVYWETLAIRFSELQKQYLRNIALKIPPKVHRLSFFLMMSMMLLYVVVLGWELLSNMGVLFG